MSDLASLIETRLMEFLEGSKEPECEVCGRKGATPSQMLQALRVGLVFLQTRNPKPEGPAAGSGFKEDEDGC